MPRLVNRKPKLGKKKRGDVTYAVVRLNNRIHVCGRWGTKEAERKYKALLHEWIEAGCSTAVGASPKTATVSQLCAAFWKHAKTYYNGTNAAHFKRVIKSLRTKYGSKQVSDFGGRDLKALRQSFVDSGASRTYANESTQRVKQIFKWGTAEDMVPPSVHAVLAAVAGLRVGKTEARENDPVQPVPLEHFEATLEYLPEVVADLLRVQFLTGARPGEIRALTPGHVNTKSDPWEAKLYKHKTAHHGRPRVLFFGPKAQAVLAPYLLRGADEFCFSPKDSEKRRLEALHDARTTPLSCGNKPGSNRRTNPKRKPGGQYTKDSVNRAIMRAVERLNAARGDRGQDPIPCWSANQLRHLRATMLRAEFDLETSRTVLGHSKSTTSEVYAEKDFATARAAVARLG
jgi:integrase